MQRAVFIGKNTAILKSAFRLRRIAPAIEVNLIDDPRYAAPSLDEALDMVASGRAEIDGFPTDAFIESLAVKIIKAEIDSLDLTQNRLYISGEHGQLRLPYNFLCINAQARASHPAWLTPGERVFLWPDEQGPARLIEYLDRNKAGACAVAGEGGMAAGLVGALLTAGRRVTWLRNGEAYPLLGPLDLDMARIADGLTQDVESLTVLSGCGLKNGPAEGDVSAVCSMLADGREIAADCLIWCGAPGAPGGLTRDIGLLKGRSGLIRMAKGLRTSIPGIYALGSGVETPRRLTEDNGPSFGLDRQIGSALADVMAGHGREWSGSLDTQSFFITPETRIGRCGLSRAQAASAGIETEFAIRATPGAYGRTIVKLVAETATRRVIGGQALGGPDLDAVLAPLALAIAAGTTLDELTALDLGQRSAADALPRVASALANKLGGNILGITAQELRESKEDGANFCLMDVRSKEEWEAGHLPGAEHFALETLKADVYEVPRFTPLVVYSQIGDRAYNAAAFLRGMGAKDVYVLDGGWLAWPFETDK